ncbi:MAG: hypothetical protein ABEI06_05880 [Halobacteriaceae archaeon]
MHRRQLLSSIALLFAGCSSSGQSKSTGTPVELPENDYTGMYEYSDKLLLNQKDLGGKWQGGQISKRQSEFSYTQSEADYFQTFELRSSIWIFDTIQGAKDQYDKSPVVPGEPKINKFNAGDEAFWFRPREISIEVTIREQNMLGYLTYIRDFEQKPGVQNPSGATPKPQWKEAKLYIKAFMTDWY